MVKEQIEEIDELTTVLYEANHKKSVLDYHWLATEAYNAGYRKQSEKRPSKGCEYCKGRAYTQKPLTVITKYGRKIELVFEFCPNCGRKMKGGSGYVKKTDERKI